ncbi:SHOCT domain-containing protein [Kitasatospora sp. NPDC059146]
MPQLERLVELRRSGMLTEDEFTAAKQRLLAP